MPPNVQGGSGDLFIQGYFPLTQKYFQFPKILFQIWNSVTVTNVAITSQYTNSFSLLCKSYIFLMLAGYVVELTEKRGRNSSGPVASTGYCDSDERELDLSQVAHVVVFSARTDVRSGPDARAAGAFFVLLSGPPGLHVIAWPCGRADAQNIMRPPARVWVRMHATHLAGFLRGHSTRMRVSN